MAREIAQEYWNRRQEFEPEVWKPEAAIHDAIENHSGRTVLTYSADGSGTSKIYCFECTPNLIARIVTSTQPYTLTANINTDTWYYAALTYNGSLFSLYINGSLSTSTAASGTITYEASANLNLGRKILNISLNIKITIIIRKK